MWVAIGDSITYLNNHPDETGHRVTKGYLDRVVAKMPGFHTGKYANYRYPKFTDIPFDPKNDEYPYPPKAVNITYDGLHPSDKGNKIIAKRVADVFNGIFP